MNDLLCTSACRCVMNDPVCVLYPVSVHCLFMNAPVYACVDYTCECSLSSHEWPCVCYLWVFIVLSWISVQHCACLPYPVCSLSDHVWPFVCMSTLPCECSLSDPVCAWVYYHVSVIVWSCVTLCVLYHVSVHCLIMCDPVCAWVYYHVSVHCLVMNDPVCAWVYYHVSVHCLVMNNPVCAWVYYHVSVHCLVMNDTVCAWVYYHVSVHCLIMCDPVCAWVHDPVSVHCLVMNDPVCAWVYYPVSVHCLTMCDPVCAWVYCHVSVHCLVMNDPVWQCTHMCITCWALSDHKSKPCVFLQVCITLCPSHGYEWSCMYFPSYYPMSHVTWLWMSLHVFPLLLPYVTCHMAMNDPACISPLITLCPSHGYEWPCMYFPSECSSHGHEWPYMILVCICVLPCSLCDHLCALCN